MAAAALLRDPRTVVEPLTRLKRLLETDDGEAADFMIDSRSQLAGVLTAAEIETLSELVGDFNFESALKCLSSITDRLSLNLKMTHASDNKLVLIVDDTPTNVGVISGVLKGALPDQGRDQWREGAGSSPLPRKNPTSSCST